MNSYMMTAAEIRTRFRDLDPKQDRIRLLAELNGCEKEDIVQVLQVAPKKRPKQVYKGTADRELMKALYDQGLNDDEIAAKVGRHKTAICQWRMNNDLPPHRKQGRRM